MTVKLPKGLTQTKARKAVRSAYGLPIGKALLNLILDAMPASRG